MIRLLFVIAASLLLGGCVLAPLGGILGTALTTCAASAPCDVAVAAGIGSIIVLDDHGLAIWNERHPVAPAAKP